MTSQEFARSRLGQTLLGKYQLESLIAVGGMAAVYAATHRNRRGFAVKILHPEMSAVSDIRARFLREGKVANTVDHPGVVDVLDDDIAEDGSAFLVMELLEGQSLDAMIHGPGKGLPLPQVLEIADQTLDVLNAAHACGVIHRDLKPANLFLTDTGRVKVLDFGTARLREVAAASSTESGVALGTAAFMSPEQATGRTSKIDARTDLWGFGATLFTLISGEPVHAGKGAQQLIVNAATQPARSLATVAPTVHPAVVAVVDRALAFEKAARFADAATMREALQKASALALGRRSEQHEREQESVPEASDSGEIAPTLHPSIAPMDADDEDDRPTVKRFSREVAFRVTTTVVVAMLAAAGNWLIDVGPKSLSAVGTGPESQVDEAVATESPPDETPPLDSKTSMVPSGRALKSDREAPQPSKAQPGPIEPPVYTTAAGNNVEEPFVEFELESAAAQRAPPTRETLETCSRLLARQSLGDSLSASESLFFSHQCKN